RGRHHPGDLPERGGGRRLGRQRTAARREPVLQERDDLGVIKRLQRLDAGVRSPRRGDGGRGGAAGGDRLDLVGVLLRVAQRVTHESFGLAAELREDV